MSFSRRHARELALQALYGTVVGKRAADEMIAELAGNAPSDARTFVRELVFGTIAHAAESDALIAPLLEGWTLDRLPTIDRILLQMSVFELRHRPQTDAAVVINEAVELAKRFSTEDSGRYVNGVLGRMLAHARAAQPAHGAGS